MSYVTKYNKGDWEAVCDVCGRKFRASKLRQRWDGLMVCHNDWEIRQPQDFVRGVPDPQIVPWVRPEGADQFVGFCTPNSISSIVDWAVVDCAIVEYISPAFDPTVTGQLVVHTVWDGGTTIWDLNSSIWDYY